MGPEVLVGGIKEQVKSDALEKSNIQQVTERHRMTVEERRELPFFCTHCERRFSQPMYLKLHKCVTTRKKG